MKKQVSILLGLCSGTKYLLCDETFDGLDPVVRQAVKSLFAAEILNRDFTPIISSHNLRELEDFCDSIGLLHQGQLLLTQSPVSYTHLDVYKRQTSGSLSNTPERVSPI